jgi:DNA invertase Pin-like site-specific DNA recombinase
VYPSDVRCAGGTTDRPGFRDLVGRICEGTIGAVFCLEASRLARNGRDWHHLLELCGLVGAYVIDSDGVHDPGLPNDRLLLGLKGTMSEFELTLIRKRLVDAAVAKARRGELRIGVPVGYVWSSAVKDGKCLTMVEAADKVGVSCHAIRKLIRDGILPAKQYVFDAPWQILAVDLERPEVQQALRRRRKRAGRPCRNSRDNRTLVILGT